MRYCQIYDFQELGRITLKQYRMMKKAIGLQVADKMQDIHLQAWLNQQIKATRKNGNKIVPHFKTFKNFFVEKDYYGDPKREKTEQREEFTELLANANRKGGA